MFSACFISRPKFAFVISIVISLAGFIALSVLPVKEFPDAAPPQVQVTANYTGAYVTAVEQSVAAPIEDKVNGVDDSFIGRQTVKMMALTHCPSPSMSAPTLTLLQQTYTTGSQQLLRSYLQR